MIINYNLLNKIEQKYGESWYILYIDKFKHNFQELSDTFTKIYPDTKIAYSYKTNYIPTLCKIVNNLGGYAEVVSEMEYDLALAVGVNPTDIIVNGPYKPAQSFKKYLLNGSIVNLDSYAEYILLSNLIKEHQDKIFNIGIRCNFELNNAQTSRFGFDINNKSFYQMINELVNIKNVRFKMIHCHYPYRDLRLFEERIDKMIKLYKELPKNNHPYLIDIGGGLGGKLDEQIKQQLNYNVADYQDYANVIAKKMRQEFENDKNKPTLILEPGTALVANTMQYVCKVVEIKNIRNRYIAMTSGSKINYHRLATKLILPFSVYSNNSQRQFYDSIDISGYTCMEDDYLYNNYRGELSIGDYLVFDNVGSYSIVYKPPFILPNVPIITLNNGLIEILKEAETFEYIFQTYHIT
jgi:diaminopimelate decarboxylase